MATSVQVFQPVEIRIPDTTETLFVQ